MSKKDWQFTEAQRDAVCKGDICPRCLHDNVESTGSVPDGMSLNQGFRCSDCGEEWEGY
jgi:transposase-like protein